MTRPRLQKNSSLERILEFVEYLEKIDERDFISIRIHCNYSGQVYYSLSENHIFDFDNKLQLIENLRLFEKDRSFTYRLDI